MHAACALGAAQRGPDGSCTLPLLHTARRLPFRERLRERVAVRVRVREGERLSVRMPVAERLATR
jgi:hypothetical protein